MNTIQDIIERYDLTANDRVLSIANLAFDLSVFDISECCQWVVLLYYQKKIKI